MATSGTLAKNNGGKTSSDVARKDDLSTTKNGDTKANGTQFEVDDLAGHLDDTHIHSDLPAPNDNAKPSPKKKGKKSKNTNTSSKASVPDSQPDAVDPTKYPFEKRESKTHGNGLFVTKDVAAGELILKIQRPCLAALDGPRLLDTCSNCFTWTGTTFREENIEVKACSQCKVDRYCGKKCQVEAWKRIHKYECKALGKATNNGARHLPSSCRLTMQLLVMMNTPEIPKESWSDFMALHSHLEELKGSGAKVKQDIELLSHGALHYSGLEDKVSVMLAEGIFAMTYINGHALVTPTLDPLGIMCDPLLGTPNHSCAPNAFIVMDGPLISFRAFRPLKKGDEIFVSYIDVTNPFKYRQAELQQRYQFTCACTKCAKGDASPESQFAGPWSQMPPDVVRQCEEYLKTNPAAATDPSFAITNSTTPDKPDLREALSSLLFAQLEDIRTRPQTEDKEAALLAALRLAAASTIYPPTRQPYPALRQDHFVSLLQRPGEAFKQALKVYFAMGQVYPEAVHPIRVVYAWSYAKLAIYLSSPGAGADAVAGDPAFKEVDWNVVVYGLLKEVVAEVGKSHGGESTFAAVVKWKLAEVRGQLGGDGDVAVARIDRRVEGMWKVLRGVAEGVEG